MTDDLGTDAQKWAKAFMKAIDLIRVDEEFMFGWFANAIMAGHDSARRKYEMVNRHEHSMSMLGIDIRPETSQPEPININELKRLLVEVVADILKDVELVGMTFSEPRDKKIARLTRQIENAILNGDDS